VGREIRIQAAVGYQNSGLDGRAREAQDLQELQTHDYAAVLGLDWRRRRGWIRMSMQLMDIDALLSGTTRRMVAYMMRGNISKTHSASNQR
jgi:hypothetical protein